MALNYTDGKVEFEGAVLREWSDHNYQIMSDVWGSAKKVDVWNEEKQCPQTLTVEVYDGGNAWGAKCDVTVDATPEVLAKVREYYIQRNFEVMKDGWMTAAKRITKDCQVKVVSGRTAKGTVGKVVFNQFASYRMGWQSRTETKLAVATSEKQAPAKASNGRVYMRYVDVVWVWERNCERVDVEPFTPEIEAELMERAAQRTDDMLKTAFTKWAQMPLRVAA